MNLTMKDVVKGVAVIIVIILILALLKHVEWNDGKCIKCPDGHWTFVETVLTGKRHNNIEYRYECDTCGYSILTYEKR